MKEQFAASVLFDPHVQSEFIASDLASERQPRMAFENFTPVGSGLQNSIFAENFW